MESMHAANSIDFGYPWWLSYGHLAILVPALLALLAGSVRKWPRWLLFALALVSFWSATAFFLVRPLGANSIAALPTENFIPSGNPRVLDLGAGTGRSSIMVLRARPHASLVALDLFSQSFDAHFGRKDDPRERLRRNLAAAGVENRASIVTADIRELPFEQQSFDAIVSAYAVDHLGRAGAATALQEAFRVLKPGGEFLLILVANDARARFAFGPLLSHGGLRGPAWWRSQALQSGFQIAEQGSAPLTLYFVLKRPLPVADSSPSLELPDCC
jgi:SAM-dependent methyltransferase